MKEIFFDDFGWENILNIKSETQNNIITTKKGYEKTFKNIDDLSDIAYPLLFGNIINDSIISSSDRNLFEKFVFKYGNIKLSELAKPSREKIIKIDDEILAKFYLRLYSIESPFYKELNKNLRIDCDYNYVYSAFICKIYNALKKKEYNLILGDCIEVPLFPKKNLI